MVGASMAEPGWVNAKHPATLPWQLPLCDFGLLTAPAAPGPPGGPQSADCEPAYHVR